MRSPNVQLTKKKHVNLTIKKNPESPIFLFPCFFYIPKHDVNLEIEGFSFGFVFLRWNVQFNVRQSAWRKKSSSVDLVRANAISLKIKEIYGQAPDAVGIVKAFDRNRWLRELTARAVEETHYGLRIIRDAAKEEALKKDTPTRTPLNTSSELFVEGLE